jgi:protein-L-isoaspartate(D-aspartate) O-methyltransferase
MRQDGANASVALAHDLTLGQGDSVLVQFLLSLRAAGIRRSSILAAFEEVPRRFFLPPDMRPHLYANYPLPIGCGEEATPPAELARILSLANPGGAERVLEIGTGTGFQTALLAKLCRSVVSVERWHGLSQLAADRLQRDQVRNVNLHHGDGLTMGFEEKFDLIIINASVTVLPEKLLKALKQEGRLVCGLVENGHAQLVHAAHASGELAVTIHGTTVLTPARSGISRQ